MKQTEHHIALNETFGAHNYHPLPVVLSEGQGVFVTDVEGRRYFDFLSSYSAMNHGHRHPAILKALHDQAERLTLTSRAFHNDKLGPFLQRLCEFSGYDMALPMNTGAEAVETAIKLARKWGVEKKGVCDGEQEIIVCTENFHGRTVTIVSFSTDEVTRRHFSPATPGFRSVPFGDSDALEKAITPRTVAFLVEPIQGEAGVVVPPDGYLRACRDICSRNNVLLIADEIQTGLGRTGEKFACDHEQVKPDVMCLGKALGAGVLPVSAVVAQRSVMEVFTPGSHGSTFGGNPLACAVALAALNVVEEERLAEKSAVRGETFRNRVREMRCAPLRSVRGKGLLNALVFEPGYDAHTVCLKLMEQGLLAKQTHGHIIRFAPPLTITSSEMNDALSLMAEVLERL